VNAGAVVVVGFLRLWGFMAIVTGGIWIIIDSDIYLALAHYFPFFCLASFDDCP
jgi:hypothetical protein